MQPVDRGQGPFLSLFSPVSCLPRAYPEGPQISVRKSAHGGRVLPSVHPSTSVILDALVLFISLASPCSHLSSVICLSPKGYFSGSYRLRESSGDPAPAAPWRDDRLRRTNQPAHPCERVETPTTLLGAWVWHHGNNPIHTPLFVNSFNHTSCCALISANPTAVAPFPAFPKAWELASRSCAAQALTLTSPFFLSHTSPQGSQLSRLTTFTAAPPLSRVFGHKLVKALSALEAADYLWIPQPISSIETRIKNSAVSGSPHTALPVVLHPSRKQKLFTTDTPLSKADRRRVNRGQWLELGTPLH